MIFFKVLEKYYLGQHSKKFEKSRMNRKITSNNNSGFRPHIKPFDKIKASSKENASVSSTIEVVLVHIHPYIKGYFLSPGENPLSL